ncbi:hypothetical protein DITRI_Ditri18aG0091500 [Diplodiscus trichospermus]
MVTSSQVKTSGLEVAYLKRTNAAIGCDGNPFTVSYLVNNLGFERKNIKNTNSIDDYKKALSSGKIKAAFLSIPDAKVFLAKYCGVFTKSGHAYNLGSFGFVFPRYSPLASDISEAILKLKDAGKLQQMEKDKLSSSDCPSDQTVTTKIGPGPFTEDADWQRTLGVADNFVVSNQRRNELQLSSSTSQTQLSSS